MFKPSPALPHHHKDDEISPGKKIRRKQRRKEKPRTREEQTIAY
jgi:hypothetical protein